MALRFSFASLLPALNPVALPPPSPPPLAPHRHARPAPIPLTSPPPRPLAHKQHRTGRRGSLAPAHASPASTSDFSYALNAARRSYKRRVYAFVRLLDYLGCGALHGLLTESAGDLLAALTPPPPPAARVPDPDPAADPAAGVFVTQQVRPGGCGHDGGAQRALAPGGGGEWMGDAELRGVAALPLAAVTALPRA